MHVKKSSSSFREGERRLRRWEVLKDAPLEEIEKDLTRSSDDFSSRIIRDYFQSTCIVRFVYVSFFFFF